MYGLKTKPAIGAGASTGHRFKVPMLFGGATLLAAIAYLAWILIAMRGGGGYGLKVVKHGPNYSIFYLIFMPLITALTVYCEMEIRAFSKLNLWLRILFVGIMLLVPTLSLYDAQDKGTPTPISHLAFPTLSMRKAAIDSEVNIRKTAWSRNGSLSFVSDTVALNRYKSAVGGILGVSPDAIQAFASVKDFLKRGSAIAFFDLALSTWGAGIALYFFLILMYTLLGGARGDEKLKHCFFMVFWLWTVWFPTRGYAMWYQNFYCFQSFGNAMVVGGCLAIYGLLLINLVARKKHIKGALTVVFGILAAIFPVVAKVKPEYVAVVGDWIDGLPLLIYMVLELMTVATLGTFSWVYFNQIPAQDSPRRPRRP